MNKIALQDISDTPDQEALLLYERRRKIHPRLMPGHFRNWRLLAGAVVLGAYFLVPWMRIDGRQAVLFDLPAREFHVFWLTFQPQDLILLSGLLMALAFALFLVTTLWGRLWCGYSCPQTLWSFMFIRVERFFEGERNQRIRLDAVPSPPSPAGLNSAGWNKLMRRTGKHTVWLLIALATGATFIAYFHGARELLIDSLQWQLPLMAVAWVVFFTLATYINAGWLREHVCIYICPYARFQSVMYDDDTLAVSYDPARGEPRGARKRNTEHTLGDCVDCQLCVQVCPTGIDIREGLQYQCIACAACIDACDMVMDRMQYPRGLIRYATLNELNGKAGNALRRPKAWLYGGALLIISVLMLAFMMDRAPVRLDVIRDRGPLYQELADGSIENVFNLFVRNSGLDDRGFTIDIDGLENTRMIPDRSLQLPPGESLELTVRVQVPKEALPDSNTRIHFVVTAMDGETLTRTESRFIGPADLARRP